MKSKEKKPMPLIKRILSVILKVLLVLLCLIVVAVAVFAVMFRDAFMNIVKNPSLIPYVIENFDSLSKGLNITTDDLESEVKSNEEAQAKAFAEADINLSESDIGSLSDETLTEAERAEIIYNAMTSGANQTQTPEEDADSESGETVPEGSQAADEKGQQKLPDADDEPEEKEETKNEVSSEQKSEIGASQETSEKPVQPPQTVPSEKTPDVKNPKDNVPTAPVTNVPAQTGGDTSLKMTDEQYNIMVSELVAKMYSIKADFMAQLSAFESRIISEYKALPAEQRTNATKVKIVSENMNYVMGLEAQCDAQVKAVTDELTAIMTANGKSTALVDQIKAAYINEKEIKKAHYVSMYK